MFTRALRRSSSSADGSSSTKLVKNHKSGQLQSNSLSGNEIFKPKPIDLELLIWNKKCVTKPVKAAEREGDGFALQYQTRGVTGLADHHLTFVGQLGGRQRH